MDRESCTQNVKGSRENYGMVQSWHTHLRAYDFSQGYFVCGEETSVNKGLCAVIMRGINNRVDCNF